MKLSDRLLQAYNLRDDILFDKAISEVTELANTLKWAMQEIGCLFETACGFDCRFCNSSVANDSRKVRHKPKCPWLKATNLVATNEDQA